MKTNVILAVLNCAGSILFSCGLTGCAGMSTEERSALIRIGETTAIRILDSKFPPPQK